jgi:hypothetical protein
LPGDPGEEHDSGEHLEVARIGLPGSRCPGGPWRRCRRSPANQAGSLLRLARNHLDTAP